MGEISAADIAKTIREALAAKYPGRVVEIGNGSAGRFARVAMELNSGEEFTIQIEES
jgi:hypothetical protein